MRPSRVLLLLLFLAPAMLAGVGQLQHAGEAHAEESPAAVVKSLDSTRSFEGALEARPLAEGVAYKDPYTLAGPRDFMNGYSAVTAEGTVHVVVEIPAGCTDKWEVKEEDGLMHWDFKHGKPRWVHYLGYPCNYGMVPRTVLSKERGGDGDPIDILVMGAAVPRGSVVEARVIGLLRMRDGGELDEKIVAVRENTPFAGIEDIGQLEERFPGVTGIIETWFAHYKGPGIVETSGFGDASTAQEILREAVQDYEELHGGS